MSSTDNLDIATEREEFFRNNALRLRKPMGPAATGFCLHCEKKLDEGIRWCDALCRDDWQREQKQ